MDDAADLYLRQRIRKELARDPRLADLSLEVEEAGGRLHVMGSVATPERRQAAEEVVADAAGTVEVVNDVTVVPLEDPGEPEQLA
jgi:osmotically-inducible protein OsmY